MSREINQRTKRAIKAPNYQLRRERELRGWSQRDVAERIDAPASYYVSRWELGTVSPGPLYTNRLCELFGKNAEELGLISSGMGEKWEDPDPLVNEQITGDELQRTSGGLLQEAPGHKSWGEMPDTQYFCDRERETRILQQWIVEDSYQIITLIGTGGIGKSTLATRVMEKVKSSFESVFWYSLHYRPSLEAMLVACLQHISGQQELLLPDDPSERITLLMSFLRQRRCLIVLDNIESILQAGQYTGHYQTDHAKYEQFFRALGEIHHKSCLLLVSREKPVQMVLLEKSKSLVRAFRLSGLEPASGRELLKACSLTGSQEELSQLVDFYGGNPLALKLIAESIQEVFDGHIDQFLQTGELLCSEIADVLHSQFQRLTPQEQRLLFRLVIDREPVAIEELRETWSVQSENSGTLLDTLNSLRRRSLIELTGVGRFTLQPVVMEYVTDQFVRRVVEEIATGDLQLFASQPLLKASARDALRESQVRTLLAPIAQSLLHSFGYSGVKHRLRNILVLLQQEQTYTPGYAAGNLINLLLHLKIDMRGIDFSRLVIKQAYMDGSALPAVNFSHANLASSVFSKTFGSILCVQFSPCGERLAVGTASGEILIWDLVQDTVLQRYQEHADGVRSLAFHPSGDILVSASEDETLRLWDCHSGRCFKVLEGHVGAARVVCFSPGGDIIVSGGKDHTVKLWDSATGRCLNTFKGHNDQVQTVAVNAARALIATGSSDGSIRIWEAATGRCDKVLQAHSHEVRSLAFSPDGALLASGGKNRSVCIWDVDTGHRLYYLLYTGSVRTVAFSPDGKFLGIGGDDHMVHIWDVSLRHYQHVLKGHTNRVWSLAFSPNGNVLASGGEDQTVRYWDYTSNRCLKTLQGYHHFTWSVAFSPDNRFFVSGCEDKAVRLWNTQTGNCLKTLRIHENRVRCVAYSPDGVMIASGSEDRTIQLWDARTLQPLRPLSGHKHLVSSIAFSPDGRVLASCSHDKSLRLWDVDTGMCVADFQAENLLLSVAFSPDGRYLATSNGNSTISIWEKHTGRCLHTLQGFTHQIWSMAFSSDGRYLVSGGDDHMVRLWEPETGHCLATLEGHSHWVRSVVFSPDGNLIASGSHDQTIRIWQVQSGHCLSVFHDHSSWVWSVALSSDGRTLLSSSQDGTIKLWDVATGICIRTVSSERPYEHMDITGATGITVAQRSMLKSLGAIEDETSL